jgi:putative membrane protein
MSPPLKSFLKRWLVNTFAVLIAANVVRGISYDTATGLLVASLVLGVLNSILRPLLILLSLPLLILTLGLFTLVINAVLLLTVSWLVTSFHVDGFWPAFWGALVISLVSLTISSLAGGGHGHARVQFHFRRRTPPPSSDQDGDGDGPVIDV